MLNLSSIDLFYGAAQALRQVSLQAQPGKVTAILGRNGVGKSSLMRAIIGHQRVTSGEIAWNGQRLNDLPSYERVRRGVAYVPQGREIFPLLSVKENLETGFAPLPRSERFVPQDVFDLFPVLKEMLHRRGGDLSGGQQQQLAIARALVTRPSLLLMDEPTEGIQPSIIKQIGFAIDVLRQRGTMAIVLVEQYFDFARDLCDDYVVLERGRVALAGTRQAMVEEHIRRLIAV